MIKLHAVRWRLPTRDAAVTKSGKRWNEQGFTLVEMLVVLGIIGLIMAMVGPRVIGYLSTSKVQAARIQIGNFSGALDLYYLDNGNYPSSTHGLNALVEKPEGAPNWNGPYLKGSGVPADPWGRAYVYTSPGQHGPYDIVSLGADGSETTSVSSWQK